MGSMGLRGGFMSDADRSFKMVCLHLLEKAYCEVKTTCSINKDWTENAISEALKKGINDNEETILMHITAEVEVRQLPEDLSSMPSKVDAAPRIDIKVGGFGTSDSPSRVCYYMEAKNLYAFDFKKTGYTSVCSSTYYAKRYVSTGINHLCSEYYPGNTILLGYVLIGTIQDAVDKVNQNLINDSRDTESINLESGHFEFPTLVLGYSMHPNGIELDHCFLQF